MEHNFDKDIDWFVRQIESRKRLLPTFAHAAGMLFRGINDDFDKFIDDHAYDKVFDEHGELKEFGVPQDYAGRYRLLKRSRHHAAIFADLLPKMTLVSLVSLFDAYLARLLRTMFIVKPEIINASEKHIKFSDLIEFESFDDARDSIIGMEIEGILRESHADQFKWLESKLNIPLRKLDSWSAFVEITERRNLFVHADGVVNRQYISVCEKSGVALDPNCKVGHQLDVPPHYYQRACDCIAEMGVKLAQVMWRKLLPADLAKADDSLVEVAYNFLVERDYGLALALCELCDIPAIKNACLESEYYLKINKAIALKGLEKDCEMKNLLDAVDWSVLAEKFQLAYSVLNEDWESAYKLMLKIGGKGDLTKQCYREWPLFRWFRKTDAFKKAYFETFGEEYKIIGKTKIAEDSVDAENINASDSDDINDALNNQDTK
jgi:hypothetical protein